MRYQKNKGSEISAEDHKMTLFLIILSRIVWIRIVQFMVKGGEAP